MVQESIQKLSILFYYCKLYLCHISVQYHNEKVMFSTKMMQVEKIKLYNTEHISLHAQYINYCISKNKNQIEIKISWHNYVLTI